MCVFILALGTLKAERYYESESTTWANVTCNLGEPQIKYHNRYFEVNEALNISDDVWIGYIYVKIPLLLLGCASLQSENGVDVNTTGDCFTICNGGKFGIKRSSEESGLMCICIMVTLETNGQGCTDGDQNSLCNDCYEIYTLIHVNASNVMGSEYELQGDCLTYFYPHFKWQPCSRTDPIRSLCSNSTYTDLTATATIDGSSYKWSTGNKVCLTKGLHPSFERSITNTGFYYPQQQNHWTGIFRESVLIKLSLKDFYSRFSTDSHVFANGISRILWVADIGDKYRALCVTRSESTSSQMVTSKYTTEVTHSVNLSTYSETSLPLTNVTTPDIITTEGSKSRPPTTHMYTTLATDYSFPTSNDGNEHTSSEKSTTRGIGIGVSVVIVFLVGGAAAIVVLKRREILHCKRKSANDKPLEDEPAFKNNTTYGKRNDDNVAHNNYFTLEKCAQSISNTAEYYNEANEANMEDDYNTIHDPEEQFERVKDESSDYDNTTNAFTSGSDAKETKNVYNKLKIDRPGDNGHGQRTGHRVDQISEDDYDTTLAIIKNGEDDVSDYNHFPPTANKACASGNYLRGNKGEYDAISSLKLKVSHSDESDYAHVNKDAIK
ncbi:hypothetical protein DPMN_151060 [Dreissena polymorpha]|uniref:Uncharacterized protein n=3 Tax=Dreissena polymorpha TaxID=45954 RepID=A0A9D4J653_DREPO|nr:hypothetical protein DPMN_151060 [Dreissena polymorpha]